MLFRLLCVIMCYKSILHIYIFNGCFCMCKISKHTGKKITDWDVRATQAKHIFNFEFSGLVNSDTVWSFWLLAEVVLRISQNTAMMETGRERHDANLSHKII